MYAQPSPNPWYNIITRNASCLKNIQVSEFVKGKKKKEVVMKPAEVVDSRRVRSTDLSLPQSKKSPPGIYIQVGEKKSENLLAIKSAR